MKRSRASLLVAAFLAGCGGHAGSSQVPATTFATAAPHAAAMSSAKFSIAIPKSAASQSLGAKPAYVSPATQSISIAVAPSGGTAGTPVIINVSTGCTATTSGTVCTTTVPAPVGSDVFTVNTYDSPNATGNLLASGTVSGTIVAGQANTFPITLGGTIASIKLTLANPYPKTAVASSTTLAVAAYDASNSQILGSYTTPISLSAPAGLTLSSSSVASSSAAAITVSYDGVSRTTLTLSASSGSISGSTQLVPGTNVVYYQLPTNDSLPFIMKQGPDGAFYFGEFVGPITTVANLTTATEPGRVGRIDESGNITEVQLSGINPVGLHFDGNDLYIAEQQSSSVGRIKNGGAGGFTVANYSNITLPSNFAVGSPAPGSLATNVNHLDSPRSIAQDANGILYVANKFGDNVAYFDPSQWPTPQVTEVSTGAGHGQAQAITRGGDGNMYVTEELYTLAGTGLGELAPLGSSISLNPGLPNPGNPNVPSYPRFIERGADGNLYYSELDADGDFTNLGGSLTQYIIASQSFARAALPNGISLPDSLDAGSTKPNIAFVDLGNLGVGIYNYSSGVTNVYPMLTSYDTNTTYPQGVSWDSDGSLWFTAQAYTGGTGANSGFSKIGHLVFAEGFTTYPDIDPIVINGTGVTGSALLGVAGSGTYTLTATSSNTSVCTVSGPVASNPRNFIVTGVAPGTCTVTITDQNGHFNTRNFTVNTNSLTIQSAHRRNVL